MNSSLKLIFKIINLLKYLLHELIDMLTEYLILKCSVTCTWQYFLIIFSSWFQNYILSITSITIFTEIKELVFSMYVHKILCKLISSLIWIYKYYRFKALLKENMSFPLSILKRYKPFPISYMYGLKPHSRSKLIPSVEIKTIQWI